MVFLWGTYSYCNNEQIHIVGIEIMTATYGSSGSFGSRLRSKFIGHNKYTGRKINFGSKPTQLMDQFTHIIWMIYNIKVTSVSYYNQLQKYYLSFF